MSKFLFNRDVPINDKWQSSLTVASQAALKVKELMMGKKLEESDVIPFVLVVVRWTLTIARKSLPIR